MFKYVLHRFFKNKKSYLLIVIIIITFLIMSISPYLTGSFVDFMINNKDVHRVVYLSSIIMLIGIVGVVLAYCKNTLSVKITSQVSFDLLRDITKHFENGLAKCCRNYRFYIFNTANKYRCKCYNGICHIEYYPCVYECCLGNGYNMFIYIYK